MTSFDHVMIPTCGNWFQKKKKKKKGHESMNRMIALVIEYLLCVLLMVKIWHLRGKFDQHLSLYCGSVKPKFKIGPGYWFLWESCELWFPKFTDNFGTVSLKTVLIFIPLKKMGRKPARSVCLKQVSMEKWRLHDVSLYQRIAFERFLYVIPTCTWRSSAMMDLVLFEELAQNLA